MCRFCGELNFKGSADAAALSAMLADMRHRGAEVAGCTVRMLAADPWSLTSTTVRRSRRSRSRRVSHLAPEAQFRFGIEEEYFLAETRNLRVVHESPAALFDPAHGSDAPRLYGEFLQSQLEVATRPHVSIADARLDLVQLRRRAAAAAAEHDLAILAAGTHPTARWREAVRSPVRRPTSPSCARVSRATVAATAGAICRGRSTSVTRRGVE